jgi:hypothetical protein
MLEKTIPETIIFKGMYTDVSVIKIDGIIPDKTPNKRPIRGL